MVRKRITKPKAKVPVNARRGVRAVKQNTSAKKSTKKPPRPRSPLNSSSSDSQASIARATTSIKAPAPKNTGNKTNQSRPGRRVISA